MSGMCDDMCDVLYDVMLYCNVVQSFVVERHTVLVWPAGLLFLVIFEG